MLLKDLWNYWFVRCIIIVIVFGSILMHLFHNKLNTVILIIVELEISVQSLFAGSSTVQPPASVRDHLYKFHSWFSGLSAACLCDRPTVLHDYSEWSLTGRLHDSKAPRSSHLQKLLRANMCTFVPEPRREGVKTRESRVVHSLFCKFKTLVSFPEAAAFAWLDQADLGLSRRPGPSPLDGSSASHATCSTRGAVPRRTAKVAGESAHSPGG